MLTNNHNVFGLYKGSTDPAAMAQGEPLGVATHSRKLRGPRQADGHFGFTLIPSGTFSASMTVWYSHLPNPDPTVAAHWFQDTDLGTITLTAGTTDGRLVGNVPATWVRFSVVVASGTLNLSLWVQNGC